MTEPQDAQPPDLAPIQARVDAATAGLWWNDGTEIYAGPTGILAASVWIGETCNPDLPDGGDANGTFTANAKQDVADLLAEVLRLRELLEVAEHGRDRATEAAEQLQAQLADVERLRAQYATLRSDARCVAGLLREIDYYARTGQALNFSAIRSGADALDSHAHETGTDTECGALHRGGDRCVLDNDHDHPHDDGQGNTWTP